MLMTDEEAKDLADIMEGRAEEIVETNKRLRGIQRQEHFAEGRTLEDWRGITRIQLDKRKEASRRACRNAHEVDD